MAAYDRRDFQGGAVATTLSGDITSGSTSIGLAASTGWPTAANGSFGIIINRGGSTEEKVLCSARSTNTLTVAGGAAGRGVDGTSAAAHTAGEPIEHVSFARDFDESNYAVAQTVGKVTTAHDLLVASGANAFNRLAKGSDGQVLRMASGSLGYGALGTDTVDSAQIIANAVGLAEITPVARYKEKEYSLSGVLTTGVGAFRWYPKANVTIVDAWASVGTAPTGASLIVDINNSGTTIFTTQSRRPTITASSFYGASGVPDGDVTLVGGTDYLTVDVDQIGSTIAGSNLVVGFRYYET